ncbi:transcription factor WhiB [Cellulomonas carbonis T26]|uniref:Transcriptional regulator WhiB n=2 Tax=Cellulomonas carbonis TaxID=1386092 RepID=A0A0A0BVR3_9CELL|nr:transcription factor WhiB [Cellulomonas carbonis T26]
MRRSLSPAVLIFYRGLMGQEVTTAHVGADQHWTAYGLCGKAQPDELFVEGAAQRTARQLCGDCAVRLECLVDALDNRVAFGVWGGMTERERRALLRRRPEVVSWREVLEAEPELVTPLGRHMTRHVPRDVRGEARVDGRGASATGRGAATRLAP